MTKLRIEVTRDAHDDEFIVVEERTDKMGTCDNCGRDLHGGTILGHFHDRKELMIYLTAKIKELSR